MMQLRRRTGFALKSFARLRIVNDFRAQHFYGDRVSDVDAPRGVNRPHAARPNALTNFVATAQNLTAGEFPRDGGLGLRCIYVLRRGRNERVGGLSSEPR
jgi:hypothetical protein